MKKIICAVLALLSTFCLFSQNYVPFPTKNATWYETFYDENIYPYLSSHSYSITGDTSIYPNPESPLINYHIIIKKYLSNNEIVGGIRENSQKQIFFYSFHDETEFLIFDFSKNEGDTIFFDTSLTGQISNLQYRHSYYVINKVDSVKVSYTDNLGNSGNKYRKRFVTNNMNSSMFNYNLNYFETWVEGIGSDRGLLSVLIPDYTCYCVNWLGNFSISDTTYSFNPYLINSVSKKESNNNFIITPNPSSGSFIIKNMPSNCNFIEVYNICGKKVIEMSVNTNNEKTIDLSSQPNGIYLLTIKKENIVLRQKLIKY